jgi:hypothetical protein
MTTWYKNGGCVCGTSERTAVMSRSISFYIARDIPTGEIEQTMSWLTSIRDDCDHKIARLESVLRERERAQRHRDGLNRIASQFCDPDSLHLDLQTRVEIIRQRLGCDPTRARHIALLVDSWAKRQRRYERDRIICLQHDAGTRPGELAKRHKLTRQQINNILKKRRDRQFI